MKLLRAFLAAAAATLAATGAHAQLFRAYLSVTGNDANPCTVAAPCRLLPAALAAVSDRGEIWMLDSANYNTGAVTLDKSVTILAVPGAVGSIVSAAPFQTALVIHPPAVRVTLRNLVITALDPANGALAVQVSGGTLMSVEDCTFANFAGGGMQVANGSTAFVRKSTFRNLSNGLQVLSNATATVADSHFSGNNSGITVNGLASTQGSLTVTDSRFSANVVAIQLAPNTVDGSARAFLTRVGIDGSTVAGLNVSAPGTSTAKAVVTWSSIVRNPGAPFLVSGSSASIVSLGNNQFSENGAEGGTLTPASLQ